MEQQIKSELIKLNTLFLELDSHDNELGRWRLMEKECNIEHIRCIDCKFHSKCDVNANLCRIGEAQEAKSETINKFVIDAYPLLRTVKKNKSINTLKRLVKMFDRISNEYVKNESECGFCGTCLTCKSRCSYYKKNFPHHAMIALINKTGREILDETLNR